MNRNALTLALGVALGVLGAVAVAFFWGREVPATAPAAPEPPPAVGANELENTRRKEGVPHRIAQSVSIQGPVSAKELKVLSADAYATVHVAQVYVSTIVKKTREEIVERRAVETSGFLVLSLEMTDHSLRTAIEVAARYGVHLAPGLYKVPAVLAAELARRLGDRAMESWMEGRTLEEVAELARQLGLEVDDSLRSASRFPRSLEEMAGKTYRLTYRAGLPPAVELEDGGEMPDEVRHFLERTSFFLDARFFAGRGEESFDYPAEDLQQYLFTSFLPSGSRIAVDGRLTARPSPRPVLRPGLEPMTEFRIEGDVALSIPTEGSSRVVLSVDPRTSKALLGNDSGYLREVEVRGTGEFAHRALSSIFGVESGLGRVAEGEAELAARLRCDPAP